ncbi:endonuclease/exonuclease/phosphatase family protein [Ilumatobacter sp.]|uniref:endonuclease/exonuclease/phosphatase family protein n=1 Tax=Ilumatobacter sp. TaxID=1967498 RepID=UPI003B52CB92
MPLRVMTWNLWWHFGPWRARAGAILDTIRDADPDVVCLQEVFSDATHDQGEELATELGFHVVRTEPVLHRGVSFGNAVLARWPVVRLADERLPRADGTPGHRRAVVAGVDTPHGRWPIASTHLEHRFDRSADRCAQVRRVMELARDLRGDPERDLPVVVGGDLNAVPDTDEIRLATGRTAGVDGIVMSDAWEQVGDGDGRTWLRENPYSCDSAWPDRRIDYVLVSWPRPKPVGNPISARLVGRPVGDGVWPSDHLAVVVELVTPADGTAEPPA